MADKKTSSAVALFLLVFSLLPHRAAGDVFEYKHFAGNSYRIISIVNQEVFVNRVLSHRAEILNRIAVDVIDVKEGKGLHKAVFQTSERASYVFNDRRVQGQKTQTGFQWAREYESVFERDKLGYLTIDPKYYMPVVRNVPVFPDKDIKPAEGWTAEGYEMHDFRDGFGIEEPYRIPFTAHYIFLGNRQWKGKNYPAFSVMYRIDSRPPAVRGLLWPRRITGASDQIVYWDHAQGQPIAYEETFRLTFELSDGRIFEFRGTAEAEIIESETMDKDKIIAEITDHITELDIPDVKVKAVDEGVTISLENIGFYPDSNIMLPGEQVKLDKIADILRRYPDRDIMVSGHTALAGTGESRMKLSIERAGAVTDYLLSKKVRTADRIVIRGFGAEKPVADNSTEEGMRQNRRVEITILEN
jgi:outer membrane protein OmpA-like peptidoglycan-associated protein